MRSIKQNNEAFNHSPGFTSSLASAEIDALVKQKECRTEHSEFTWAKVGRHFSVKFHAWQYNAPSLKIEITITKPTLSELESAIIEFFKP